MYCLKVEQDQKEAIGILPTNILQKFDLKFVAIVINFLGVRMQNSTRHYFLLQSLKQTIFDVLIHIPP